MPAAVVDSPGRLADVLAVREVDGPEPPGAGEVVVRMPASTVHPCDEVAVSGAYGTRTSFPLIPGFDGVGVIEAAGPGVPAVTTVDRFRRPGVRAVVVRAATSAIGGHLAELLTECGVAPVGVVRGTPGRTVAEPSRWRAVLRTNEPGWRERLRALTGPRGTDVTYDCVGGGTAADACALTSGDGVFVHYGLLSGTPLPAHRFTEPGGARVELSRLRAIVHGDGGWRLPELFAPVFGQPRRGRLRTAVAYRVGPGALADHLRAPAAGRPDGKILIEPRR
ncbi:zinc-binding dehydrogenase [Streptomyces sp. NPDC094031]|uniref:zinc-binding dehydrogenase n=1 Tax=Streptomyces sp. NPDC094031 TaxID=3155307 RepID=UPI003324C4D5